MGIVALTATMDRQQPSMVDRARRHIVVTSTKDIIMAVMLSATFDTRRDAEMTVERLVQQFDIDRAAVFITTEGDRNSTGEAQAGSDTEGGTPSTKDRDDAPLNGAIVVTVDVADEHTAEEVRDAFGEFDAAGVVETDSPA